MNNKDTLVSVIAPTYNVEAYLARAIESIQSQTHTNLELIIVIDGSPDGCAEIANEYARNDKRIKVIQKENGGVSSARNIGIEASQGEYICFIDPDDYVEPDYIEYMLSIAINNSADISLTTKMFGSFNNKKNTENDNIKILSPEEATAEILYYHIPIGCYCKLFRRDFINKHNIRFLEDLFIGEGFNFNTTTFQYSNRVAIGQRKTYFYNRENTTSAMTKFNFNKCVNGLLAIENIRKNLHIRSKKIYRAIDFAYYHTNADFLQWMDRARVKNKHPEMYNNCRRAARRKAFNAFLCPVGRNAKLRAFLTILSPTLLVKIWNIYEETKK